MNEQIKKLAEQAGLIVGEANGFDMTRLMPREVKFAELIVKECANQVDWILAEGGKTQGDLIKEHFGVEE
jgi:hypothetical protein